MFSICLCERFQKEPREVHSTAVKSIFKYLIGTPNLGLCSREKKVSDSRTIAMQTMLAIKSK